MYKELRTLYVEYIYFVCIWYWVLHIGTMKYAYCIQFCNAERERGSAIYNAKKDLHCGILYIVYVCKLYAVMTDKLVDSVYTVQDDSPDLEVLDKLDHVDLVHEDKVPQPDVGVQRHGCRVLFTHTHTVLPARGSPAN
jgi:hypothetical protein